MGHRSRGHEVGPAYQGLRLDQQVLDHLDAVLRGVFLVEFGELLPDILRDVDAGNLMVQELRLASAPQGYETQQELDVHTLYLFERVLQSIDLEHWLCPEGVRASLELLPELVDLSVEVFRSWVEGRPDEEAGRFADRVTCQVLAMVELVKYVNETHSTRVEDPRGFGEVPDLGRITRDREDVLYPQGRRAEEIRLKAYDVPVAAREVGDDLDPGCLLDYLGYRERVHPQACPSPVRDVYRVDPALFETSRSLYHSRDVVTAWQIHLDSDRKAGPDLLGERRPGLDRYLLDPLHGGD